MVREEYLNRLRIVMADKMLTNVRHAHQVGLRELTVSCKRTNKVQPSMAWLIEIARLLKEDRRDLLEDKFDYVLA